MGKPFRVTALVTAVAALVCGVTAIPKVTRTGKYLYTDDGNRFYIKGIAYQEQGTFLFPFSTLMREGKIFYTVVSLFKAPLSRPSVTISESLQHSPTLCRLAMLAPVICPSCRNSVSMPSVFTVLTLR